MPNALFKYPLQKIASLAIKNMVFYISKKDIYGQNAGENTDFLTVKS